MVHFIFLFLFTISLYAQQPSISSVPQEILNRLDAYLADSIEDKRIPGAAFVLIDAERSIFQKGYGYSDLDSKAPFTPETILSIGSSTRLFTIFAATLLRAEGRLDPDKKVIDFLPWYKHGRRGDERMLLIKHLLYSTSGLSMSDERILHRGDGSLVVDPKELLTMISEIDLRGGYPGQKYNESNLNYILLGELFFAITNRTVSSYLDEKLFKIAGMKSTGFDFWKSHNKLASSYNYLLGSQKKTSPSDIPSSYQNAYKAFSSIQDLGKFISISLAVAPEFEAQKTFIKDLQIPNISEEKGESPCCASAWKFREVVKDKVLYFHGSGPGMVSSIFLIPEKKIGFAIMMNSEATPGAWGIGEGALAIITGLEPSALKPNYRQILGLFAFFILILVVLLIFAISYRIDRLFSKDFVPTDPKPIAVKFGASIGTMVFLIWFMNLGLPYIESFSAYTHLPYNSSMYGWVPELFYSVLSGLVLSFFWTIYYAMLLARNSGR